MVSTIKSKADHLTIFYCNKAKANRADLQSPEKVLWKAWESLGDILVLMTFQFCDISGLVTNRFWWDLALVKFSFGDIPVLVTFIFLFWWNFSFDDLLVLMKFYFWWFQFLWHFSLDDNSVLMTFDLWSYFSFGEIHFIFVTFQSWWYLNICDILVLVKF